MDRRTVLSLGAMALTTLAARGETAKGAVAVDSTEVVPLWPGTPPGGEVVHLELNMVERSPDTDLYNDRFVSSIGKPYLAVYRPAKPDGSALLVAPGGGYVRVVIDKEGLEAARRLNASGVTVFVLYYRLPGEGWSHAADVPLQDAQRAIRLIRAGANTFGIDANRLGVMGFSAGGHLAASLATRQNDAVYDPIDAADKFDARPNFAALMYPVITMTGGTHPGSKSMLLGANPSQAAIDAYSCEKHVPADMPPTFIALAADDDAVPPGPNGIAMFEALRAAKRPAEMHVFQEGGHGFGLRLAKGKPASVWPDLFLHWGWRGGWFRDSSAAV